MTEDTIITIAAWVIILGTVLAVFNTYKWWNWQDKLGGKALRYLYRAGLVATVASIPLAVISAYRLLYGPDADPLPLTGPAIALSVALLVSNLTITTFAFRDLDDAVKSEESVSDYLDTGREIED